MLALAAGDYALTLAPERGGAVLSFDWRGRPLMTPAAGPAMLDAPYRPLVPFLLELGEQAKPPRQRQVWLGSDPLDALDGTGAWTVTAVTPHSAALLDSRGEADATAPYVASQSIRLDPDGLTVTLSLVNLGRDALPAALGVRTLLPRGLRAAAPCTRPLEMHWPEHALTMVLEPSDNLAITALTAPGHGVRCCAEPLMLSPGGVACASLRLRGPTHDGACAPPPRG